MPGPIPEAFFVTSEGVPNPAVGGVDAYVSFVLVGQEADVREELELDINTAIFVVRLSHPAYPGYTYVAEMTKVEATPPPKAPTLFWYWPSPSPMIQMDRDSNQIARASSSVSYVQMQMVLLRRRVYSAKTPVYLTAQWTPLTGETITIEGVEKDPRATSVALAYRGIKLLKVIEAVGGRPREIEDKAAFWQLYWDSYQKVLEEKRRYGNKIPYKTEVAAEMLRSVKSLKRDRDHFNLPWPPLPPP